MGFAKIEKGIDVYFGGVDENPEKGLATFIGSVLHVIFRDSVLDRAREKAYRNIQHIVFEDHNNNGTNCPRFRNAIDLC